MSLVPVPRFLPVVGVLASVAIAFVACTACSSIGPTRVGPVASPVSTVGPNPQLAEPDKKLLPIVQIAPATGWPAQGKPTVAQGLAVKAFATGLDHPRWIHVLPNGDVLVAETNAPPREEENSGLKSWIAGLILGQAGAAVPSANRITLLRDSDGDGVAETRTVFLEDLNSPL